MWRNVNKISSVLAFMMFFSFGASAFAISDTPITISNEKKILSEVMFENAVIEGDTITDKFVDKEGRQNKMVIETKDNQTIVSLFIDGTIEQQSIVDKETGILSGFSEYGESTFEKNLDETVTAEDTLETKFATTNNGDISTYAVGYYSQVATKKSVPNALCNKTVTAYLYEKSTTTNTSKMYFNFSKGELLTAIVATIVTAIVLRNAFTLTILKEMLVSIGVGFTTTTLTAGFKGYYKGRKDIKDYYATINGTRYFTSKITKQYVTIFNSYNGKGSTKLVSTTNTGYGSPTSYQVMLSQAIATWGRGCK
ncbi:MAG: hypothetical protein N2A99_05540 [Carnobacterium alterfunditum]|uniref:hypothetical protein n=1 Tax=Planococcus halocryophilus TaxID=1215089 RepID=UPI001F0EA5B3|nr:hypothetical protein [Planococcus halocryophilus]MCH4828137.1 hypothetical protein [Planococcus halocryophilus]